MSRPLWEFGCHHQQCVWNSQGRLVGKTHLLNFYSSWFKSDLKHSGCWVEKEITSLPSLWGLGFLCCPKQWCMDFFFPPMIFNFWSTDKEIFRIWSSSDLGLIQKHPKLFSWILNLFYLCACAAAFTLLLFVASVALKLKCLYIFSLFIRFFTLFAVDQPTTLSLLACLKLLFHKKLVDFIGIRMQSFGASSNRAVFGTSSVVCSLPFKSIS